MFSSFGQFQLGERPFNQVTKYFAYQQKMRQSLTENVGIGQE